MMSDQCPEMIPMLSCQGSFGLMTSTPMFLCCRNYGRATSLSHQLPLIAFILWCQGMSALGYGLCQSERPPYYDIPYEVIVSQDGRIVQGRTGVTMKKRVLPQLCAEIDVLWWGVKGSAISMKRVHPQKEPRTNLTRVKIRASQSSASCMCSWWLLGNWSRDLYMQY